MTSQGTVKASNESETGRVVKEYTTEGNFVESKINLSGPLNSLSFLLGE